MYEIKDDVFYDLAERYDADPEHHCIGEVIYYLLSDDKPYDGLLSHREALRFVFERLEEKDAEGDKAAVQLHPWIYDVDQALPSPLKPREFFYCPQIVKKDYYGNVWYDAEWYPNDENFGTTVPYWYALLESVYGRKNTPEDFRTVNRALFPNGTEWLTIYEWTTDWSDFFDAGHEWYGACCWSIYDWSIKRYVVMLVSATD